MRKIAAACSAAALLLAAAAPVFANPHHHHHHHHVTWGAISFAANGSFASNNGQHSKYEAEAKALANCLSHHAGGCVTTTFTSRQCAALVTAKGLSFTHVAYKVHDAIVNARNTCELKGFDRRQCELRTVVCGDNR